VLKFSVSSQALLYVFNALVSTLMYMVSESEFINNIKSKYSLDKVGDDCAVLPKDADTDILLTTDLLIEDIDFRLEWTTPEFLGHKALAVSLSDIAAMGGEPKWAMLSIGVSEILWKTDFLDRFYGGWYHLAAAFGVELVGGDVSRSPDKLVIDSIVGGEVAKGKAILRSGAGLGDAVFVSGYIGAASAGLAQLESGQRFDESVDATTKHLLFRQLQPLPQIRTANILQTHGLVSAMIDISDGLSSDLRHLARASGVGFDIDLERIPIDPAMGPLVLSEVERLNLALNGGEDFELLMTVRKENFSAVQDLGFYHIGDVTANIGIIALIDGASTTILEPKGYRHF
jgi:thiamine-monophosphate kinase